jgi:hypothetical protein
MNNNKRPQHRHARQNNKQPPYKQRAHVTPESCNFNFINELHDYMITTAFIFNANSLKVRFTSAQSENMKVTANAKPIVLDINGSSSTSTSSASDLYLNALFVPSHKDSLFWCMYVILNGFNKYELLNNQHFIVEQHEKIRAIELLRANKSVLKEHKIKPFSELENNLTNDFLDIKTFFAIAIVSKLNVIYIHNRMYFDFFYDSESNNEIVHVIHQTDHFKGDRFLNSKFSYESSTFAQVVG